MSLHARHTHFRCYALTRIIQTARGNRPCGPLRRPPCLSTPLVEDCAHHGSTPLINKHHQPGQTSVRRPLNLSAVWVVPSTQRSASHNWYNDSKSSFLIGTVSPFVQSRCRTTAFNSGNFQSAGVELRRAREQLRIGSTRSLEGLRDCGCVFSHARLQQAEQPGHR